MEGIINTTGRRKSAIARLYLSEGEGNILINGEKMADFFRDDRYQYVVMQPLNLLEVADKYDIKINVKGGGITGQAEAIRLGIARALVEVDAENKSELRKAGFLTRDPRAKERKKPGQPSARKQFQFSKR
ncbi:MAG: 30S ribosomal protein S9 [Bacteroidales bacterium]|nr:30S ribosomal protein S9 [Bacteroidales bacterium]